MFFRKIKVLGLYVVSIRLPHSVRDAMNVNTQQELFNEQSFNKPLMELVAESTNILLDP